MKCPYCDNEMAPGYLQSSRALVWDTEILHDVILPRSSGDGMILTKKLSFSKALAIESHFCKGCNILLSPLAK